MSMCNVLAICETSRLIILSDSLSLSSINDM